MSTTNASVSVASAKRELEYWNPEDSGFWESTGSKAARRNRWISIPCLLCSFCVWSYWSIITVQMRNLEFPFTSSQLFTLTAIDGLTAALTEFQTRFKDSGYKFQELILTHVSSNAFGYRRAEGSQ